MVGRRAWCHDTVLKRVAFRWVPSVIAKFFPSVALHTRVGRDTFGFSPGSAQRSRTRCRAADGAGGPADAFTGNVGELVRVDVCLKGQTVGL